MKTLTAVLFTGGESRRMGVDKATLLFEAEPLWSRQLRTLRELSPKKILISTRTKPGWCPPEIEAVLDKPPSRGPLSGLVAVLKQIETTHLLALAVDMPFMDAATLEKLFSLVCDGCGIVPKNVKFFEPLAAIYPKSAVEAVCEYAEQGGWSLQPLIDKLIDKKLMQTHALSNSERKLFHNANSLRDWERTLTRI